MRTVMTGILVVALLAGAGCGKQENPSQGCRDA